MGEVEIWRLSLAAARTVAGDAARAESQGYDGFAVVDSQNLSGDAFVALAIAAGATERIGLGTAVTNPVTRHPAVMASAIAAVHIASGGRATLGIGRGDSALAHLGRAPAPVALLEHYLEVLQSYLRGEEVPFDRLSFHEEQARPVATLGLADTPSASRVRSIPRDLPKVVVEVASTGPKVIAAAARHADRVMLAVGADPARIAWGIETAKKARAESGHDPESLRFGAYLNVIVHPDIAVARELVRGGLSTFARFSVMHGRVAGPSDDAQRQVLDQVHGAYDMKHHTRADSDQASLLPPEFVDRFAVVGPAECCTARLRELIELGLDKLVVIGPTSGADPKEAELAVDRLADKVIPALRC